jgi:hypothetical protein
VALVRTDVSEELNPSIIRMTKIGELEKLAVTSYRYTLERIFAVCMNFYSVYWLVVRVNVVPSSPILVTLMMDELSSSETSALTRATRRNISEDGILHKIEFVQGLQELNDESGNNRWTLH